MSGSGKKLRDVTLGEVRDKPVMRFDLNDFTEPARSTIRSLISGGNDDVAIIAQVTKEPKPK